jgi:hypothetical protein
VWEHFPLAAGAVLVEEGVEDLPHVNLAGPSAELGGGDEGLDELPLGIGQIGSVRLTHRRIGK